LVKAYADDARRVHVEIADNGVGFTGADGARAGRRFASGAGRDSGGFGLGLSIATQAVELSGGSVAIQPRPERGTIVLVELPGGSPRTR
jgi:signal transduction histidine kinase